MGKNQVVSHWRAGMRVHTWILLSTAVALQACGGGDGDGFNQPPDLFGNPPVQDPGPQPTALDDQVRALIDAQGLTGDASTGRTLPAIGDPLPQLGMRLFFSKALGGEFDSACVSCHHPALGGADNLSLSVGIGAVDPDLVGLGRGDATGVPNVPRNAPTTFNIALWDSSLFWDSRVASLGAEPGQNGAASGISTPDSGLNVIDPDAGANLTTAQARFPVTSVEEMRGDLELGQPNDVLRAHLEARIGDYGVGAGEIGMATWLAEFQDVFRSAETAENLITFDNIVAAIAEYERSQVFVNNAWKEYVQGDLTAINDQAKEGAVLFFTPVDQGGAGCVTCHSGDFFTDEQHHAVGAPQFGPGKGNGPGGTADFGRENISGNAADRFRFRTPTLLNVSETAPYMHTGAYATLQDVVAHYSNPRQAVNNFFAAGGWCQLPQFDAVANCDTLYPNAENDSNAALGKVDTERAANDPLALPQMNLDQVERDRLVAFLLTLTDPCLQSRDCVSDWVPDPADAADTHQLNAVDINGNPL